LQRHEIVGDIAADAESIALGMMLLGGGAAFLDDVVLEVRGKRCADHGKGRAVHGRAGGSPSRPSPREDS
jgi:hypothetical protein